MAGKHETIRTACPLDCWDACALLVDVEDGRAVAVRGDPDHPITAGFACPKAQRQLERLYSPSRLLYPLVRPAPGAAFQRASWDSALDLVAERLTEVKRRYGPLGILLNYDAGAGGLLKSLERRFWNLFGGVTLPVGSLCWGGGIAAQKYDFGDVLGHDPADTPNSRLLILWGRNPVFTSPHFVPLIKKARTAGARVVLIDPVRTASASLADQHIAPRPGSDGALALGMASAIIEEGLLHREFIAARTKGFEEFAALAAEYPPERAADLCDVPAEVIRDLARLYAETKPAAIHLGYGLQRYANGGAAIRAIDALGALTGNIGRAGGGVNYANRASDGAFPDLGAGDRATARRGLVRARLGAEILAAKDPPIKALFVTRSNPVAQSPNTNRLLDALGTVDFKVVVDLTLTDTAAQADVVLPCTTPFEEEDVCFCSWHNHITYGVSVVAPVGEARSDLTIYSALAGRLGFGDELSRSAGEWIEAYFARLAEAGVRAAEVRGTSFRNPFAADVPWADGQFKTPSGRFEFASSRAAADGHDPLPGFAEPVEWVGRDRAGRGRADRESSGGAEFPLQLITPRHRETLNSQFYMRVSRGRGLEVEVSPGFAEGRRLADGEPVRVVSPRGEVRARVRVNGGLRNDVALIYAGGSLAAGEAVNLLTADRETDLGHGAAYYDCCCDVQRYG
ncbi:MAG TPA: molybdopterin-dependent oxidoreductase [Bacillota bacterium]